MAKIRKSFIGALVCLILILVGSLALTACGSKDYTVTFSIEGKEQTVDVVDGKVAFPKEPTKEYYEFRGWYTTDTFDEGTEFTSDTKISGNVKVYAYFAPIYVDIALNGGASEEIKLENLSAKTTEYTADAESKNLTFDGWYIDANYGTEYSTQDVDNLYARYVATVTFDNGYETVYTERVQTGTVMKQPDLSSVQKYYMDSEDLSYVDSEGKAFDFTKSIDVNTTVIVRWKTPYLMYKKISGSANNYAAAGLASDHYDEWSTYPCISVLSKDVTIGSNNTDGTPIIGNVVAVKGLETALGADSFARIDVAEQLMFEDGIEYIKELTGSMNSSVERIILPSTLKILEKSIWYFKSLKELEIPEGTEVIIDCFWSEYLDYMVGTSRDKGYDFDIVIPSGVKTLSLVPTNVKFAEGSPYYVEDNRIYKKDGVNGKILVSDYWSNVDENGALTIPKGVTAIQVGVLETVGIERTLSRETPKYIYLPSTLKDVSYTVDKSDYNTIYDGNLLTEYDYLASPTGQMNSRAYAIVGNLGEITYVIFNTTEYPFNEKTFLFVSGTKTFDQLEEVKLVYTATVAEGDIAINVAYSNSMENAGAKHVTINMPTGSEIKREELLEQLGLTSEAIGINIKVTSIKQFGADYEFGVKNCNQYLDITYDYDAAGVTTKENADGTLTVTGLDTTKAQQLDNGTYLIVIPNSIDGKEVTAIAEGAFKGENRLSKVYISNSVKTIGAEAFMNTENLEFVSVTPGGLEFIGRSAFENAGAILDNGVWKMNPAMPKYEFTNSTKPSMTLQIPLANLKTVEPYAFKSVAICAFKPVQGEENRKLIATSFNGSPVYADLKENGFYFMDNSESDTVSIVQYVSTAIEEKITCNSNNEAGSRVNVNVYDVRLIARAPGYTYNGYGSYIDLGWSFRVFSSINAELDLNVARYEIMEGAISFVPSGVTITFGLVSKVHTNAFTDMGSEKDGQTVLPRISVYNREGDGTWLKKDDIVNQSANIFEEGWWEGVSNKEDGVMTAVEDNDSLLVN